MTDKMKIRELVTLFQTWADVYYTDADNQPTREAINITHALRPLYQLYARRTLDRMLPDQVACVRQSMIDAGLSRSTINARIGRCRRFVRWCIQEGYTRPAAILPWQTLQALKYGRSDAVEPAPVVSVPREDVYATMEELSPTLRAMVELQLATGMRSSELCSMRWDLIDRSRDIWLYKPSKHKTQHHGHTRLIPIAPLQQANLGVPSRTGLVFPNEKGEAYTRDTYRVEIKKAIKRAGCNDWTPHQLRHNAATLFAETAGSDAAGVLLGHRDPRSTARYTDHGVAQVLDAVRKLGNA